MSHSKFFRIHPDGPPGVGLGPISVMDQSNIVEGEGKEIGTFDYIDPSKQLTVGIWESTPCTEFIPSYPCDEFCYIITGGITVTDEHGYSEHFGPGQGFMVLRGLKCHYKMTGVTRKYSIMFENKMTTA